MRFGEVWGSFSGFGVDLAPKIQKLRFLDFITSKESIL
jgi:hypothetical protein